jgi:hypothetical protein
MRISIGRYRLRIGLDGRWSARSGSGNVPHDLRDHELRILRDAEREHRERDWASRSLLSGSR